MNNSVYGKQIENVRNRVNIKFTNNEKKDKYIRKANFKNIMKLSDSDAYLVEMGKNSVTLDKPIYGGLAVLDHSKITMFNFMYNYIKPKFGDRYELLMTDTDSFMGLVQSNDFYDEIKDDVPKWFDTSNMNLPNFPNGVNKKVPGKFKDEMGGLAIKEFVGLRAKQYGYAGDNNTTTLKNKGINKQAMKSITFQDYKDALAGEIKHTTMNIFRSRKHVIYSESIQKKALDKNDDKRIILENGIDTVPFGWDE